MDVRDHAAVAKAIAATVARFGGLDIVINNAGLGTFANVADMTPDQWARGDRHQSDRRVQRLPSPRFPNLRKRGGGYIINISSLAGKNAVRGRGGVLRVEGRPERVRRSAEARKSGYDNISVTTIAPGSVATGFSGGDESKGADWKIASSDIGGIVIDLLEHGYTQPLQLHRTAALEAAEEVGWMSVFDKHRTRSNSTRR